MDNKAGKLIVIEGVDGVGKATQTEILARRLKNEGFFVETIDFPRYGQKSAALIEDYLNRKFGSAEEVGPYRASIFYACDRYVASFKIKEWLREGKIVISNRYVSASMGHQAGKIKDFQEREKFLDWLENLEFGIFQIPKPDVVVLLHMLPEIGQKLVDNKPQREYLNGEKLDMHEGDINHLNAASAAYLLAAEKYNWIKIGCVPDGTINSLKSPNEIGEMVYNSVKGFLE